MNRDLYLVIYSFLGSFVQASVVDRHRFDTDLEPTFHLNANPDPDPTQSFTHVRKSDFFDLKFTAVPVYIVLSSESASQYSLALPFG
jgi:hypothetical protein